MIGIIGAMDIEVDLLKQAMENAQECVISGIRYLQGKLCGKEAVVARCGVGKVNAAVCAQTMILEYKPEVLINTGVAGSLSNALDIGSVAIADFVVQGDIDTTALGEPAGLVPSLNVVDIPCSPRVAQRLMDAGTELGLSCTRGTIATSDTFVASAERKAFLTKQFGAIACEMEGGSIGQVCCMNGVDFGIVRAISDKADGSSHMDYGEFCAMAAKNSAQMLFTYLQE